MGTWKDKPGPKPLSLDGVSYAVRYLHAGQLMVVSEPALITTVLGSCVSVCLWDGRKGLAGINHFSMPLKRKPHEAPSARFGEYAIPELVARMEAGGASRQRLVAGVFGGTVTLHGAVNISMGYDNAGLAYDLLREFGISVAEASVGGDAGRRIRFNTHTGHVRVETLRPISQHLFTGDGARPDYGSAVK